MDLPTIETMASGNLNLTITEDTAWETFSAQASDFVRRFKGTVLKRIDTPVERMWIVLIKRRPFYQTFEDFLLRMTLDSMNSSCALVIHEIHAALFAEAQSKKPNNA
ncbi:hypothetical protein IM543_05920 [Massilia sp. UMI-21]|nr:hypothetical protein IM543_05920 [Massilia sp. UMI-21]